MGARRALKITNQGQLEFYEDILNGQNRIALKAPATLAADLDWTLPSANAVGFLKNNGSGSLDWNAGTSASLDAAYIGGRIINSTTSNPVDIQGPGGLNVSGTSTFSGSGTFAGLLTGTAGLRIKGGDATFKGPTPWIDVKHPDFGATGDGTTDDTAAILAAYAALSATTGGTLYFPGGTYILAQSQLIILKPNVTITGAPGAVIKGKTGATNASKLIQVGDGSTIITNFRIHDITLDGNRAGATITANAAAHLINLWKVQYVWIERCRLTNSPGDYINFDWSVLQVDDYNSMVYIVDNVMYGGAMRNGISVAAATRTIIRGNTIDGFNTVGIDLEPDWRNLYMRFCVVEGNFVRPSATQLNTFNSNRAYGISLHHGQVMTLEGATFATPIVVTITGHGLTTGEKVAIVQTTGNTGTNGTWIITKIDANQFSLNGSVGNGVWTSGTGLMYPPPLDFTGYSRIAFNTVQGILDSGDSLRYPAAAINAIHMRGIIIACNQVFEGRDGIQTATEQLSDGTTGSIAMNHIRACSGIAMQVFEHMVITGNTAELNGGAGCRLYHPKNICIGNYFRNNGQAASHSMRHGIIVESDNQIIIGNICIDDQSTPTQQNGIYIVDGVNGCYIESNDCVGNVTTIRPGTGTNSYRQNRGYLTESSGTSSIVSGTTTKVVAHGLARTPRAQDIIITPTNSPTADPGNFWITAIGSTNFTLNVRVDPGASGLDFSWAVKARE